jgi:hypothetical protein
MMSVTKDSRRWALALALAAACDGPSAETRPAMGVAVPVAYITQSTQDRDGSVPLVAGRDAMVRVFVVAQQPNSLQPDVRVRLYHGSELVHTVVIPANAPGIPSSVDQGSMTTSWNARIEGRLIQPGLRLLVDVDPGGSLVPAATFPADASPRPLTVAALPPLRARLIPIHQTSTGLTGRVDPTNVESFLELARKIYPYQEHDVELGAVFTTAVAPLEPGGAFWPELVSQLDAARVAEGSSRYWYGVVRLPYSGGGVAGIAAGVPSRTALGADVFPGAEEIYAHELGHNWGRYHAPCGGAGGNDPNYPYPQGMIGAHGMDVETGELKRPASFTDIMGYCIASWWISDYTFRHVFYHRVQEAGAAALTAQPALLVWGRTDNGRLILEPAFDVNVPPELPRASGPYTLHGLDAAGQVLFGFSFAGSPIPDVAGDHRHFAFAVPLSAQQRSRLASLRLTGRGGQARRDAFPKSAAMDTQARPPAPSLRRHAEETVSVQWDAAEYPAVMFRDVRDGAVLGFGRGGEALLLTRDRELELVMSDGVRSSSQILRVD